MQEGKYPATVRSRKPKGLQASARYEVWATNHAVLIWRRLRPGTTNPGLHGLH